MGSPINPGRFRDLRALNGMIGPGKAVLFNVATPIEAMFYTSYVAYPQMPSPDQIRALQERRYRVFIYDAGDGRLPSVRQVD